MITLRGRRGRDGRRGSRRGPCGVRLRAEAWGSQRGRAAGGAGALLRGRRSAGQGENLLAKRRASTTGKGLLQGRWGAEGEEIVGHGGGFRGERGKGGIVLRGVARRVGGVKRGGGESGVGRRGLCAGFAARASQHGGWLPLAWVGFALSSPPLRPLRPLRGQSVFLLLRGGAIRSLSRSRPRPVPPSEGTAPLGRGARQGEPSGRCGREKLSTT